MALPPSIEKSITAAAAISKRASAASSARASMAGGVTCSGKALVSQCAPEAPIGVTFRQKALRYQRTAQSVLNQAVGRDASGHTVVRPTDVTEYLAPIRGSVRLDAHELHDLTPFLCFVGDELSK